MSLKKLLMSPPNFRIIYPEYQVVPASKMLSWAKDAEANGEIPGGFENDYYEAARLLNEAGVITLLIGQLPFDFAGEEGPEEDWDEETLKQNDKAFESWCSTVEKLSEKQYGQRFGLDTLLGLLIPTEEIAKSDISPQQFLDVFASRIAEPTSEGETLWMEEIKREFS